MNAIKANKETILGYTFHLCIDARNVTLREFRLSVIAILCKLYSTLAEPDYSNYCFGLQYLNRPVDVANTLGYIYKYIYYISYTSCIIL
jgi:hypothetical protein